MVTDTEKKAEEGKREEEREKTEEGREGERQAIWKEGAEAFGPSGSITKLGQHRRDSEEFREGI